MTLSIEPRVQPSAPVTPAWSGLFRLAAAAALASAVALPIQVAVFIAWPPPLDGSAADWFALLRHNRLAGMIDLDLLLVVDNVLLVPILLALFVILRRVRESMMLVATAAGFLGIIMYAAMNPAVQMAALSDEYAAATSDGARATAVAAWRGRPDHLAGYRVPRWLSARIAGWHPDRPRHAAQRRLWQGHGLAGDPRECPRAGPVPAGRRRLHRGLLGPVSGDLVRARGSRVVAACRTAFAVTPVSSAPSGSCVGQRTPPDWSGSARVAARLVAEFGPRCQ